jgi:hypothetical protein
MLLTITNLLTGPWVLQDPSGITTFSVSLAAAGVSDPLAVTDDLFSRLQPLLDAAVTAADITYVVTDDAVSPERERVRVGLVSPITVTGADETVSCLLTVPGAVSVVLATACPIGHRVVIGDATGDAGANNITISTEGADTIGGAATLVLSANYATAELIKVSATLWLRVD